MTPADWKLIVLALVAVVGLVVLVTRLKLNPFIALALASLLVGSGGLVFGITPSGKPNPLSMGEIISAFTTGVGATLGGIAAVIGLGTMLGKLLAESGGAEVLAQRINRWFGAKHAVWCMMVLALAVGLATWFAVGLLLLLPILLTLTRETKQPFLLLAIPMLACLSVMHGLMPPHPGPVVAVDLLEADMGMVLVWGLVVGIPTILVAGPLFARRVVKHLTVTPPSALSQPDGLRTDLVRPGFAITLISILLPILLMLMTTVAELTLPKGNPARDAIAFIGNPTIALMISVLFASWSLGTSCGYSRSEILRFTEQSIATIGMTLLVVGGGGGFARVLKESGVAGSLATFAGSVHMPLLIYGWLMAAFIRVATGSATVAITTAAGLLAPALDGNIEVNRELIVIAIGCGSLFLSHLNDGGFWIVKESLGLTVSQTLKTWTVVETVVGVVGLLIAYGLSLAL